MNRFVLGVIGLCIALPGGAAFAQDGDDKGGIDEIVVTARKKEESLQDVPIAVTAITGDAVEAFGIEAVDDVSSLAPNLYITQTPGSAANIGVSIRGVGGAEPLLTRDTGVGIYVDDAYIARTAGAAFELVDVERVEVLRGPQGTLYGRNATGGAVKFISRKPGEDFGFKQTFSLGRFSQFHSRTSIDTGEIADGLRANVTYLYKSRDGYVDNTLVGNDKDPGAYDNWGVRANVIWDVSEDVQASYAFDYVDIDAQPPAFQLFGISAGQATDLAIAGVPPLRADDNRFEHMALDFDGASQWQVQGHNLTIVWDLGDGLTVKSISTYRDWDNDELGTDLDGQGGLILGPGGGFAGLANGTIAPVLGPVGPVSLFSATNTREQSQFSQEFQVLGNATDEIDFVFGLYYFDEDFKEDNLQQFVASSGGFGPVIADASLGNAIRFRYDGESKSFAAYATVNWAITDELGTSVGVRYTKDKREFTLFQAAGVTSPIGAHEDFSNVDWHFNLSYAVNEEINTYFRVASGYNSGGFNPRAGAASTTPYDEETLINYEVGVKSLLLDNRLQVNAAVFYSDYSDLQTDQFQAGSGGASSITVNAADATIFGFEAEIVAAPTEDVTLYLNYGYQDLDYDSFKLLDPGTNLLFDAADDAFFAYRPKNTLSTGAEYRMPIGDGMELAFRVDGRYADDLTWHATPAFAPSGRPLTPFSAGAPGFTSIEENGYFLVDARVTLSEIEVPGGMKAKIAAWGRNVFDEEYLVSGIDFGLLGFAGGRFGEPSTFGVDITFEY